MKETFKKFHSFLLSLKHPPWDKLDYCSSENVLGNLKICRLAWGLHYLRIPSRGELDSIYKAKISTY